MHFQATRILTAALLASACSLATGATKTTTFAATATVASNCFINSASAMAFGTYTPGTGNMNQTSTIAVRCTSATPYGIGLSAGTGTGSTLVQRTMTSGTVAGTLQYNLFTTAARTVVWNNPATAAATATSQGGTGTGLANVFNHTVYGQLQDTATSQAAAPANNYTSTITVSINY